MADSTHNPLPPDPQAARPYPRRVPKPLVLPQGSAGAPPLQSLLVGDETTHYAQLCHQAARLPGDPLAFNHQLSTILASQTWEFARHVQVRSALVNLQINDDYDTHSQSIENLDDPTRQGLALQKLSAEHPFRELNREADRTFRRLRATFRDILFAAHSAKGGR